MDSLNEKLCCSLMGTCTLGQCEAEAQLLVLGNLAEKSFTRP